MKKLLLLVLIAAGSVSLFAQSFTLSNTDGPIANGTGFMVSGDVGITLDGFAFITNNAAANKSIHLKKVHVNVVNGTDNYFCWGLCYGPNTFLSIDPVTLAAGATNDLDFSAHYSANGIMGVSRIRYVFFDAANPNDSVSFFIDWNAGTVGLNDPQEQISFSSAYPNPATNLVNFNYSIPSSYNDDAQVIIKNLLGDVVKIQSVEGRKGKVQINLTDLQSGVYFYTFRVNGNNFVTKKLVVK
jgi:hypothetical protein